MIDVVNANPTVYRVNEFLSFSQDIICGCTVTPNGTTSIDLNCTGIYKVDFSAVAATTEGTGNIEVQMLKDGKDVRGAYSAVSSVGIDRFEPLAFTKLVKFCKTCPCDRATLTFQNIGIEANYTNIDIVVTKVK